MTINELLIKGSQLLKEKGYSKIEAEVILGNILGMERVRLHINADEEIPEEAVIGKFFEEVDELSGGRPLHYIIGRKEWMGLEFMVDENVLIPREDTRILLEEILRLKDRFIAPSIVEIGTGSGILPVLLKKEWEKADIHTTEINKETLKKAKENFKFHNVQIKAYNGDFLEKIIDQGIKADILISNPPYISMEEYHGLDPSVKAEPFEALVGGDDGLAYYRRIALEYKKVLNKNGFVLVEIGWKQYEDVRRIFEEQGLSFVKKALDDGMRDRVVVMEYKEQDEDEDKIL